MSVVLQGLNNAVSLALLQPNVQGGGRIIFLKELKELTQNKGSLYKRKCFIFLCEALRQK